MSADAGSAGGHAGAINTNGEFESALGAQFLLLTIGQP